MRDRIQAYYKVFDTKLSETSEKMTEPSIGLSESLDNPALASAAEQAAIESQGDFSLLKSDRC